MTGNASSTVVPSVVTIGNFDGVHLGHQKILSTTCEQARNRQARPLAFTFRPHPQSVLRPDRTPELLLTYDEKRDLLLSLGMSEVIEQPFNLSFASTTPGDFFENILRTKLKASAIVVGYDFTFGRERTGHLQVLERLCSNAGIELTVISPHRVESEVVSSSMIRQALLQGRVEEAAKSLGRPFFYQGVVVPGDQRGRQLGFPTANLSPEFLDSGKLKLPFGVYATRVLLEGQSYPAVTNVGMRPTFHGGSEGAAGVQVEAHLIDQSLNLYGQTVRVQFEKKLREELRFSSAHELKEAIEKDVRKARQILG
ncbi:MAG: bifunctional riboflavin kinase/FAD synthetase [Bdellovibrionales bacterium]|nr:bifunctional riboflavin kinase/FAD synthetase [Bdellovibrionales bacterium]